MSTHTETALTGLSPVPQYRDHRRLLCESMDTLVEVNSRDELVEHIKKSWPFAAPDIPFDLLSCMRIEPYVSRPDERIGWPETWIVSLPGFGVLGFTDGPLT